MATINLRAYNREIEGLIEQNQFDEAIAHCLHILQFVPKHIATYRLLGKAFLESKRYGDAIDIFQRLLSSVPDDFVAHVGMSIIREDEGNLDSAIWHMERAFEAQPSNPMIQDELRRLYGRRDGLTPPKIRLTRGALARMYIRGMLYQQAIAELRAALAEDPQRLDLQVLLAQAYYASGQTIEAVNTCNALLKKLPYCLEANRIMAAIMPDDQSEEVRAYRQRLISMDPYYSKISPQNPTSNEVPDKEVVIDHLDYRPGIRPAGVASQPAWATSLGVEIEEQKEALPDWLLAEESTIPPLLQESEETEFPLPEEKQAETQEPAIPAGEDQIPDWLKSAGWQPATEPETPPPPLEEIETPEIALEISEAEIPEWLKEMAPSEEPAETVPPEAEIPEVELPAWLEEKEPGVSDSVILWLGEKQAQEKAPETEKEVEPTTLPDWLSSFEKEAPEITEQAEAPTEELPEWMQSLKAEQLESAQAQPAEEVPSWLGEKEEEVTGVTDWLERQARLRSEQAEAEKVSEKEPLPSEEIPEWLRGFEFEAPAEEMPAMAQPAEEEAVQEAEAEQPTAIEPELTLPEWLFEEKEIGIEEPSALEPTKEQPVTEIPAEAPGFDEQALAWLESLAQKQGVPEEQLVSKPEERPAEMPEWILESALEETAGEIPAEEIKKEEVPEWLLEAEKAKEAEQPAAEAAVGEEFDREMEGAFEWLESLARKQGVPEDQLATHPLKPIEEPPEWVKEEAMKEEAVTAEIPLPEEKVFPQEVLEEAPAFEEEMLPSWLVEEEIPPTLPEEEILPSAVSEEPQPIELAEEETLLFEPERAAEAPIEKVDINSASLSQLEALPGVGFVLAQAILAYRETNGPFKSVDDLNFVPGFSPERLEMIRDLVEVPLSEVSITIEEKIGEPRDEQESILMQARNAIVRGDLQSALEGYAALVNRNIYLNEIVADLQESLYKYPREILLWQTLGDAYLRLDKLQEALNAYIQAEELLG